MAALPEIRISVIIPTIGKKKTLATTLRALEKQSMPSELFEVLLLDNTEAGALKKKIARHFRTSRLNIRYLHEPGPGKYRAMKTGISMAKGEFIAGTDDDCLPRKDWLETMDHGFRNETGKVYALVGNVFPLNPTPQCYGTTCFKKRQRHVYGHWFDRARAGIIGNGSNVMYRRQAFAELGDFLPFLGPGAAFGSGEEVEFFYRILKNKKKIVFIPQSVVFHDLSRSEKDKKQVERDTHLALGAMYAHHLLRGDISAGFFLVCRLFYTTGISAAMYSRKLCCPASTFHFRYRKDCILSFVRGFWRYFSEIRPEKS